MMSFSIENYNSQLFVFLFIVFACLVVICNKNPVGIIKEALLRFFQAFMHRYPNYLICQIPFNSIIGRFIQECPLLKIEMHPLFVGLPKGPNTTCLA